MITYWKKAVNVGCRRGVTITLTQTPQIFNPNTFMKRKSSTVIELPQSKRPKGIMATQKIQLTPRESQLRDLLLDAARFIDESKYIKDKIELRWAGGWVRDKLLDLPSNDIDVAINAMTGVEFCEKMQDFLKDESNMEKHSLVAKDVGGLHKILANPDKSKHLETANTRLFDFDLDFVNLRKETYSEESRNPQMEFGDAQEDAIRRDATINALFYNLHTDLVEDFTGGLEDLKSNRIRTPLEPITTFKDDPLRVLRLVRFASRLDFKIDPEVEEAMSDSAVLEALKIKISRERIGVELQKMLKGNSGVPKRALQLIDRLGLYSTIFFDPIQPQPEQIIPTKNWYTVYDFLDKLQQKAMDDTESIFNSLVRSDEEKYLAWVLAAVVPWAGPDLASSASERQKFANGVVREGIKADNKICVVVQNAFDNAEFLIRLKSIAAQNRGNSDSTLPSEEALVSEMLESRSKLGRYIQRIGAGNKHWRVQLLFAIFVDIYRREAATLKDYEQDVEIDWKALIERIKHMDLMDAESIKPIMDGKRLLKEFDAKSGPWVKAALDICMELQLENPELSSSDPEKMRCLAIEELRGRAEELKIPIGSAVKK